MDMSAVTAWAESTDPDDFRPADAWLAGGTVLFSYGSDSITRLLDITTAGWPPIALHDDELEIAATCTIAELYEYCGREETIAAHPALRIVHPACECFVASWKIWHTSTVGGNVATGLPAGPMTSWLAGLGAVARIWERGGVVRDIPVADLVVGNGRTALTPGALIRSFHVAGLALRSRATLRRASLTSRGRSAALLVGRTAPAAGQAQAADRIRLTLTASTPRPLPLELPASLTPDEAAAALDREVRQSPGGWFEDLHGAPAWRRHMSLRFAREIFAELTGPAPADPLEIT